MTFEKIVLNLMCFSRNTFYVWKREKRPIITLLEKYFTKDDLEEFLQTNKIKSQEKNEGFKFISYHYLNVFKKYLESFINPEIQIDDKHPLYIFFNFLDYVKDDSKKNLIPNTQQYVDLIEKMYTRFIIRENKNIDDIERLLEIDFVLLSHIVNTNITIEELLDNSKKLKLYYLFHDMLMSFKMNNVYKYMDENNLEFRDIKINDIDDIKNKNKDYFIKYFNLGVKDTELIEDELKTIKNNSQLTVDDKEIKIKILTLIINNLEKSTY